MGCGSNPALVLKSRTRPQIPDSSSNPALALKSRTRPQIPDSPSNPALALKSRTRPQIPDSPFNTALALKSRTRPQIPHSPFNPALALASCRPHSAPSRALAGGRDGASCAGRLCDVCVATQRAPKECGGVGRAASSDAGRGLLRSGRQAADAPAGLKRRCRLPTRQPSRASMPAVAAIGPLPALYSPSTGPSLAATAGCGGCACVSRHKGPDGPWHIPGPRVASSPSAGGPAATLISCHASHPRRIALRACALRSRGDTSRPCTSTASHRRATHPSCSVARDYRFRVACACATSQPVRAARPRRAAVPNALPSAAQQAAHPRRPTAALCKRPEPR